jgi:hypothetical protein
MSVVMPTAALHSLLHSLLNLRKRLLRPGKIAGLQILAQCLNILFKR